MPWPPQFSEADARAAIAQAFSWSEALRFLGYSPKGANIRTLQRWARRWRLSVDHFDANIGRRHANLARETPLDQILVENSTYSRGKLKKRLLACGLKRPICEMCGQGELWNGRRMSLVLDHINGVSNDNRFENLRIVCPNCAATLDTHCGRNLPRERSCVACKRPFVPASLQHRYCSDDCWGTVAATLYRGIPHPETRKVERPSHEQLLADLETMSFVAVGRKYGVSDNAIRKWLRWYQRQAERARADEEEQAGREGARDEEQAA